MGCAKKTIEYFKLDDKVIWCISGVIWCISGAYMHIWCISGALCLQEIHSLGCSMQIKFSQLIPRNVSLFPHFHISRAFANPSYSVRWMSVYNRRKETNINLLGENGAFQFVDWLVPICRKSRLDWWGALLRLSAIFLRGLERLEAD